MIRITLVCPEALIDDANHLAMTLGEGPAEALTFGAPGWKDQKGARYAVASLVVSEGWLGAAMRGLVRPAWDTPPYRVNLAGAQRAQARVLSFLSAEAMPVADPSAILLIAGSEATHAITAAGLARVAEEDQV